MRMNINKNLGQALLGHSYTILGFELDDSELTQNYAQRLLELGFRVGETVRVSAEAPFTHDPIVVEIRGSVFALRRNELKVLQVQEIES